MAWNALVQHRDILRDNHCNHLRSEHDHGMAEAPQTQPCAGVERQRLGLEPENPCEHQVRRHLDRHCEISDSEDERPVHDEGTVVETHPELVRLGSDNSWSRLSRMARMVGEGR